MWRFVGSSWSADNGGLSGTESILAARQVGGTLYASTGTALFVRQQSGWQNAAGSPSLVQALGGDAATLFAAPVTGIAAATLGGSLPAAWRSDDAGANTAFVSSLDTGNGMAFAAAAPRASCAGRTGAGSPRRAGVEFGIDARVVRVLRPTLYAGTAGNGLFVADLTSHREDDSGRPRRHGRERARGFAPNSRSGTAGPTYAGYVT